MDDNVIYEIYLIVKLKKWENTYIQIENNVTFKHIYDPYKNNKYADRDDEIYPHNDGLRVWHVIGNEYVNSIHNLALLYEKQNKYELAEKYYLMAIEKGSIKSMNNLAILYHKQIKYKSAEKYYLMAISNGYINSINNLASLYYEQNRYDLSKKYYLMAIEKGDTDSMFNLAWLYAKKGDSELSKRYYVMGAVNHHEMSIMKINELIIHNFDLDCSIKLFDVLNYHNHNIMNDVLKFVENEIKEYYP